MAFKIKGQMYFRSIWVTHFTHNIFLLYCLLSVSTYLLSEYFIVSTTKVDDPCIEKELKSWMLPASVTLRNRMWTHMRTHSRRGHLNHSIPQRRRTKPIQFAHSGLGQSLRSKTFFSLLKFSILPLASQFKTCFIKFVIERKSLG